MIVEIGTCDFDTQAGKTDGLFIEPIKYYFDRLPANCRKENVAISDRAGTIDIYYVEPEKIAAYGLPDWLRGCNSVDKPHPRHADVPPEIVRVDTVPVVQIKTLLDKHGITQIDLLKIDAEGHDGVILHDFLSTCDILPKEIFFENNGLVSASVILDLVQRLECRGYTAKLSPGHCVAKLRY